MKRAGRVAANVIAGLLVSAMYALPQSYTVSARPGAVNYVEGEASINGKIIPSKAISGKTFLKANDRLSTENGKAEVLLTPGVFVRVGENSEIRMVSPDLTQTQVELMNGSAIVEVDQLVKENNIQVLDSGATIRLQRTGLYRFTAGNGAVAQTLDGKADVSVDGHSVELGKNHQVALNGELKREKIEGDPKDTSLYAWSKVRDEYDAATSYAEAKTVTPAYDPWGMGFGFGGYGGYYGGAFAPGWAWNPFWNSYAWLPGDGAFFSPFGFGFFAPAYVAYAPVVVTAVGGRPVTVPVTTSKPGVVSGTYKAGYFEGQPIHYTNAVAARAAATGHQTFASGASQSSVAGGYSPAPAPRISAAPSMGGGSHSAGGGHR